MGRDKALLPWPPVAEDTPAVNTFLGATIDLLQAYTDLVIVVASKNAPSLGPIVYSHGAFLIVNSTPELGQFSSLHVGLHEVLNRGRDAALIALVDRPPVLPGTVHDILSGYLNADPEIWAVVPAVRRDAGTAHGHPVLIGREMIEAFLRAPMESNARAVEHAHREHILYLPVQDARVAININTPDDYQQLMKTELISSETQS
jgi:molybdenum cofactor cytidylyltransferase